MSKFIEIDDDNLIDVEVEKEPEIDLGLGAIHFLGVDPSDANATEEDVLLNKTFYAGTNNKKTGTLIAYDVQEIPLGDNKSRLVVTRLTNEDTPTTDNWLTEVIIEGKKRKVGIDISSSNPIFPESVLEGKEGFVNDKKVVGTMKNIEKTIDPAIIKQEIESEDGKRIQKIIVNPVTSSIDENITPLNIRKGVTVLGVEGNLEPDKPDQEKTVVPTEEDQVVMGDTGFELAKVTVTAIPEPYVNGDDIAELILTGNYDIV